MANKRITAVINWV